nr:restriction endonuclease subunit S [Methanobrevibacter smithii]
MKSEWGVVPESWKDIEFGELIEITSGNRPDEKSEDKTSEFNIPLFWASKIMGYTKEYSYNEDILIIGKVGTHGVVQRVNYPCFPSDNTFVIKSDYYGFVYQLLKRIDYDSLNTGSTQPLITQKSLKTVNAVLPDEKILSKFEMISKTIFDKIQLNNDELSNLTKLRDTLLPKLMFGEIDVSEVNCDLKIIIRKIYIKSSKLFLWRYLSENQNHIKNTKSNETLLKSRTIYQINKFLAKFTTRYRYYRQ